MLPVNLTSFTSGWFFYYYIQISRISSISKIKICWVFKKFSHLSFVPYASLCSNRGSTGAWEARRDTAADPLVAGRPRSRWRHRPRDPRGAAGHWEPSRHGRIIAQKRQKEKGVQFKTKFVRPATKLGWIRQSLSSCRKFADPFCGHHSLIHQLWVTITLPHKCPTKLRDNIALLEYLPHVWNLSISRRYRIAQARKRVENEDSNVQKRIFCRRHWAFMKLQLLRQGRFSLAAVASVKASARALKSGFLHEPRWVKSPNEHLNSWLQTPSVQNLCTTS